MSYSWGGLAAGWLAMMTLMMSPATMPLARAYRMSRRDLGGTASLAAGYLFIWAILAVVAALSHAALHSLEWLDEADRLSSRLAAGAVLIVCGAYQFLPWKHACLARCRAPLGFLATHWRDGNHGAFLMGLHHGAYCVACCWLLFAALFAVGAMNVAWMAALLAIVMAERLMPGGHLVARIVGAGAIALGAYAIATA